MLKTSDLYRELKLVTPDSLQYLLHDLFEVNTYWKFKIERASARKIGQGRWEVAIDLNSEKVVYNEKGEKQTVPMNDWVELGLFAGKDVSRRTGAFGKHQIRSGTQRLTLISKTKPGYVRVDPRLLLIYTRDREASGLVQVK